MSRIAETFERLRGERRQALVPFVVAGDPNLGVTEQAAVEIRKFIAGEEGLPETAGLRVRETLLPLLLLPVAAPVLLSATRAWEVALGTGGGADGAGPWLRLLFIFAVVYVAFGVVAFGALLEES